MFLLFGADDDTTRAFREKTRDILADPKSCAFIQMGDFAENGGGRVDSDHPALYTADLAGLIDNMANARRDSESSLFIKDWSTVYICPVVFAEDSTLIDGYVNAVRLAVNGGLFRKAILKPFVVLDYTVRGSNNQGWLETIGQAVSEFHHCRCCVLTNFNERDFEVYREANVNTILFAAFLHACNSLELDINRSDVMMSAHETQSNKERLFYSAQTTSVLNPIKLRVFKRLQRLVAEVLQPTANVGDASKMDNSFLHDTLRDAFRRLPMLDGKVTMDPLYAVAGGMDGKSLRIQLSKFANEYYKPDISNDKGDNLYLNLKSAFLDEFLKLNAPLSKINELMSRGALRNTGRVVDIAAITPISDPAMTDYDVYASFAADVSKGLSDFSGALLNRFFKSPHFQSLPRELTEIEAYLSRAAQDLGNEARRLERAEASLGIHSRLEEDWLGGNIKAQLAELRVKIVKEIVESESEEAKQECLAGLIQTLLGYTGYITIGGPEENRNFMEQMAEQGPIAIMEKIDDKLKFPLRLNVNLGTNSGTYCICANSKNPVLHLVQEEHRQSWQGYTLMPYESEQRMDILRISPGLSLEDIYLHGGAQIPIIPERIPAPLYEVLTPLGQEDDDSDWDDDFDDLDDFLGGRNRDEATSESAQNNDTDQIQLICALDQISGSYDKGKITFNWRPAPDMRSRIHIVPIVHKGGEAMFDIAKRRSEKVQGGVRSLQINYTIGGGGINYADFLVFSSDTTNPEAVIKENQQTFLKKPYVLRVVTGRTSVGWDAASVSIKNSGAKDLKRWTLKLEASAPIAADILGYRFAYGNKTFIVPFAEPLPKGTTAVGPIYLFGDAQPEICVLSKDSANVSIASSKPKLSDRLRRK